MSLRWDKYLWAVRLAKTRSQAVELISKGRVRINEELIKPSREVKLGDVITVMRHTARFTFVVKQTLDRRVGAKLVQEYIEDTTTQEEIDKLKAYQLAQQAYRHHGTGKPSKKDRRELDDFLSDWD